MRRIILLFSLLLIVRVSANAQLKPSTQAQLPDGASASWWELAQKNIRESEYHIRPKGDGMFSAPNRAQNLRFVYSERGFCATRRDSLAHLWQAEVRYIGVSKEQAVQPDDAPFQLSADANTLTATSDGLLMRYRNDEKGMRQDFIVKKKPAGNVPLRLWLEATMLGGKVEVKPDAVSFLTESGAEAMRYSDLKVWDANQRRLAARFEREGERLAIVVNDKSAAYPITIDPLSTTPSWTAESNQVSAEFGYSVGSAGDVNGDGFSDVIVGARLFDNGETDEGRAFVYYGNEASGFRQDLRQFRPSTTTPIVPALKTQSLAGVTLRKRQKSISGRSNTKIQIEVKPLGAPFNGTGLQETSFALHATSGTPTDLTIGSLSNRTMYKWRARQVEQPGGIGHLLLPRSRWYYPAGVAPTESHFQVSDDDLPLPVNLLFFRGASTLSGAHLLWQTASEVENAGFIITRDGAEIASYRTHPALRGQGTTTQVTDYQFLDENVSLNETYTYTLYDVSYSGAINPHPPITLTFTAGNGARRFALAQNYPNPFNPTTSIRYELARSAEVKLEVYDMLGRKVATVVNARQEAGSYVATFNAAGLASGLYFYRLQAGSFVETKKMLLVK